MLAQKSVFHHSFLHSSLQVSQNQQRHNAVDVAEFNLECWIKELESGVPLHLPPEVKEEYEFPFISAMDTHRKNCANTIEEVDEEDEADEDDKKIDPSWKTDSDAAAAKKKKVKALPKLAGFDNLQVTFLTGDLIKDNLKKSRYSNLFDRAYFGNMATLPILQESDLVPSGGVANTKDGSAVGDAASKSTGVKAIEEGYGKVLSSEEQAEIKTAKEAAAAAAGVELGAKLAPAELQRESSIVQCMRSGSLTTVETMKYQVHFAGKTKLGFRKRIDEAFVEKLGFVGSKSLNQIINTKFSSLELQFHYHF